MRRAFPGVLDPRHRRAFGVRVRRHPLRGFGIDVAPLISVMINRHEYSQNRSCVRLPPFRPSAENADCRCARLLVGLRRHRRRPISTGCRTQARVQLLPDRRIGRASVPLARQSPFRSRRSSRPTASRVSLSVNYGWDGRYAFGRQRGLPKSAEDVHSAGHFPPLSAATSATGRPCWLGAAGRPASKDLVT